MLSRDQILTPPEPVHIDTFTEKLRERVAIKSSVEWADQPSFSERFLSAVEHPGWARFCPSWWVPIPPAILAFGLWLHLLITGA